LLSASLTAKLKLDSGLARVLPFVRP